MGAQMKNPFAAVAITVAVLVGVSVGQQPTPKPKPITLDFSKAQPITPPPGFELERTKFDIFDVVAATADANVTCQRDLALERDKARVDYSELRAAYVALRERYERLLIAGDNLLAASIAAQSSPTIVETPPRVIEILSPPPVPHYFDCTAISLPGNIATIECQ
jgi:hypothetical protein